MGEPVSVNDREISMNKLVTYIRVFYFLQMGVGLIGGIAYALYTTLHTTPIDLARWAHLLGELL
jgi:hypothetical protein